MISDEQLAAMDMPELIQEVERLRRALGLKEGEKLIEGENGEYLAETKTGERYRANMLQKEMEELRRLRSSLPGWHDRPVLTRFVIAHGDELLLHTAAETADEAKSAFMWNDNAVRDGYRVARVEVRELPADSKEGV